MRRRWIRVTLAVVVLLLLLVLGVRYLVPAERWMQLAFDQLEQRTGLVATAESALISFPWPLGLRLRELRVEDPVARPGWERFEAEAAEVVVVAELGSILRGEPNVREVRLVRPVVEVWLRETAANAGDAGAPAPPTQVEQMAPVAALGLLALEDAKLTVHDPAAGTYEVTDLDNRASVDLEGESFRGTVEGSLAGVRVTGGSLPQPFSSPPVRWRVRLQGRTDGSRVELGVEELTVAGAHAEGPVVIEVSAGDAPRIDATMRVRVEAPVLYQELLRDLLASGQALPEPWSVDDLRVVAGEFEGEAQWQGTLPPPEDAPLADLVVEGRLSGLRVEVLGRGDLLELASGVGVRDGELRLDGINGAGVLGRLGGGVRMPLAPEGLVSGQLQIDLDTASARALGEQWWPRLQQVAGPEAAGPEAWPEVAGILRAAVELAWPLGPAGATPPDEAVRARIEKTRLALLVPTLRDSVLVRGGTVIADLGRAELRQVRVAGPGFEGTLDGETGGWPESMRLGGNVRLERLDVDALRASLVVPEEVATNSGGAWPEWLGGARPAHAQSASGETALPAPPAELEVDLELSANSVIASGYELREVRGKARLDDLQLELTDVGARLGTGVLSGSGGVDWTVDPPQWKGDARADAVPASELLGPVARPLAAALTTELSGSLDLQGPLVERTAMLLAALSGAAEMRSGAGSIGTEQILGPKISQFLGSRAEQWRDLDFRSLVADVRVEGGAVHFERMLVEGPTRVRVDGSVGLDGTSDYRLDVLLPAGVTPQLGALEPLADLLRNEEGRLGFGVNVTGPAAKPKVEIDFVELEQRARAKGEDRARSLLQQELEKIAPGAGEGGAAGAIDSLGKDLEGDLGKKAEEAARSLLDRLKGGGKKGGGGGP